MKECLSTGQPWAWRVSGLPGGEIKAMDGTETCTCGHTAEEHRSGKMGYHECLIEDCDCCCFEEE